MCYPSLHTAALTAHSKLLSKVVSCQPENNNTLFLGYCVAFMLNCQKSLGKQEEPYSTDKLSSAIH